jgi:hypothetical protein
MKKLKACGQVLNGMDSILLIVVEIAVTKVKEVAQIMLPIKLGAHHQDLKFLTLLFFKRSNKLLKRSKSNK